MSPSPPLSCAVAVMAKASSPGRTKTRLAPPLSLQEAADLNTTFLQDIAQNLDRAAELVAIRPYMAFAPEGSEAFFREEISASAGLIEASSGDFGDCLLATIKSLLDRGHSSACVLNSDSPTLPTPILIELATRLAAPGDRAVIGPAEDGGYYVLGLKHAHARLFAQIDWSTDRVFAQTLEGAREINLPVEVLAPWYDVDDAEGLRRLCQDIFDPRPQSTALTPSPALQTRALLTRMRQTGGLEKRLMIAAAS